MTKVKQVLRTELGRAGGSRWAGQREASGFLVALALAFLAGSCGSSANPAPTADTTSPTTLTRPPPAEQVCQLLTDEEVKTSLAVDAVSHTAAVSGPRSCTWARRADPNQPLVQLGLTSQEWLESPPAADGVGAPCGQGSTLARTILGSRDALHVTCMVDGLAVFLTARTTERSDVIDLVRLTVSRIGSIDRAAFGFGPKPDRPGTSTTMTQTLSAPPECVEAWRAGQFAPPHCEAYPEAYRAILKELGRD